MKVGTNERNLANNSLFTTNFILIESCTPIEYKVRRSISL